MDMLRYMVVERQKEWWVIVEGLRMGPFASRQDATDHAVNAAKAEEAAGRAVDVIVDSPEEGFPSVYQSVHPSER